MFRMKHIGGTRAGKGTYWNLSTGERIEMREEGLLPGGAGDGYYRFHPAVVLVAGPVLGLVYAVFLPFIGIAMLIKLVGQKALGGILDRAWKGATFSWHPSEAYLGGKRRHAKKTVEKKEDEKKE